MLGVAIIVFRETLEAALFVGIIAAATRDLLGRGRYLTGGVLVGVAGALALAAGAERIGALADGIGQDLVNAAILSVALAMLMWHSVWVSNQGAQSAADARALGNSFERGQRKPWALLVVVALTVLREGAETVLFVAGFANGSGQTGTVAGALAGVLGGTALGLLLYVGLSRIPVRRVFAVTNLLVQLLAASIASQLARALSQAGLFNQWGQTVWDTSEWLRVDSPIGTVAHALAGYEAQPTGLQVAFYLLALLAMISGTHWVKSAQTRARASPVS
ncbi:FTR1 family protein [Rhodoferax sp.]|uniref:FTR1 family iron permease n=1 Tax=Rhodoferax sp. TaxID=50421 RepID=UPI00374CE41E